MATTVGSPLRFGNGRPFEIVGHRGARTLADQTRMAPANSLACLQEAARLGASIELDVIASKDGTVFAHHDDESGKLFNLKGGDRFLREADWEEIRTARFNVAGNDAEVKKMLGPDASFSTPPQYLHTEMPTLEAIIDGLPKDTKLYIELKVPEKFRYLKKNNQLAERVAALIKERNLYDRVSVISFSPAGLRAVKKTDSKITTGLDFKMPVKDQTPARLKAFAWLCKNVLKVDSLHMPYDETTPQMVAAGQKAGLRVLPFVSGQTRSEEAAMFPRLLGLGVDGLITNAIDSLEDAVRAFQ